MKNEDINNLYILSKMVDIYQEVRSNNLEKIKGCTFDINKRDEAGMTALMWAARYGFIAVMDYLCSCGASMDLRDDKGMTALMHALYQGRSEAAIKLIQYGCDISIVDNEGQTALVYASKKNIVLPELLIDVDRKDIYACTALHYACYLGHLSTVKALILKGCNVNIKNSNGETPLMLANINQRKDIIDLLLYSGAKNYRDFDGFVFDDYKHF
jgi:ankyrin repeat protein